MTTRRRSLPALAAAGALLLASCARQPEVASQPGGRDLYLRYCASCHGESGHGDGAAAAALQPPPNDLTRLIARYNHTDILPDVMASIDGRRPVRAHGSAAMPVWGESFESELKQGERAYPATTTLRREQLIADFVMTLQRK